ncbi:MAG TPA: O-antigen ligase family protein [Vicinamibacterales bacterium]|nr:O-antigen ligase family protein [Vicinamibacterales bacterium]
MLSALLFALLAASLAVFGGTYRWSTAPLFIAALTLTALAWRRLHFPRELRRLDLALGATAVAIALQIVPLPGAIHSALSPHAARVSASVQLSAIGRDNLWRPLSLDPLATVHALATFVSAVLVFWVARTHFRQEGVRRMCRNIALLGAVLVIVAVAQRATSPLLIYGFWAPHDFGAKPMGPFVNRNNFAGWLIMACSLAAGYFIAHARIHLGSDPRDHRGWRTLAESKGLITLAAIGLMLLGVAASLSRSAIVGFAAAAVSGWLFGRTRSDLRSSATRVVVAAIGAVVLGLMVVVDPEQLASRVESTWRATPTDRLTIWAETMPMVRDFWPAGVGAGAYSLGMLVYQQTKVAMAHLQVGGWAHFNQAHSHYLQVLSEGGVLVTLPVVVALASLVIAARRSLREQVGEAVWIRIGAACGLIAIATQSIWETSLRMPANAMLCATLAAVVIYQRHPASAARETTSRR